MSVATTVNSEKMKMKKFDPILVSPYRFSEKKISPYLNFWKLYPPLWKKIHLKIYMILFRSFSVVIEHIEVFWMFLLRPAIKNNNNIDTSHSPVERDWQVHGNFSNQVNLQDSSVSGLQVLIIDFEIHFKIIHFISLIFTRMPAYLVLI